MKNPPIAMTCVKAAFYSVIIPLLLAGQAIGAVVTWNAAPVNTDTSNASQVSTAGVALFAAVDIYSSISGLSYTVNGVNFTASNANVSIGKSGSALYGTAPGTGTYASILNGGAYIAPDSNSPSNPIQLSNLLPGHSYQLQLWTPYWNSNYPTRFSDVAPTGPTYLHAVGESPSLNVGFNPSVTSQYILGTFIADSSGLQKIYYYGDSGAGLIGAIQVRDLGVVTSSGLTFAGANIGAGAAGGEAYNAGTDSFIVTGKGGGVVTGGAGFNGDNDHFTYSTTPYTGDVEIVARLVSFDNPLNGQAGLMIRNSNSPTEVNRAATWFWPNLNGTGTNYLAYMGSGPPLAGKVDYYNSGAYWPKSGLNLPHWLKLVRLGNNFGAYWSLDGRDWTLIYNTSGGALLGTGTFNVGFYVANGSQTTPSTAIFDHVSITTPQLKYKTSWIGDTSAGMADGSVSGRIHCLWVKPDDGTCYANTDWDETGQPIKAYKDGKVAFWINQDATPHLGGGGLTEGNITGNGSNLFVATSSPYNGVYRTDLNGNNLTAIPYPTPPTAGATPTPTPPVGGYLGLVGGLAASTDRLFISDYTNHNVRIVDLTTNPPTQIGFAQTGPGAGLIAHPGPIAYDAANNCFWIIDCGSPFALTDYVTTQAGYTPGVKCFSPAGVYLRSLPAGLTNPTALAKHPNQDRLLVCENGLNQNIQYYSNLSTTPTASGSFGVGSVSGQPGGVWKSTSPGTIYEAGNGDWKRFYGPTGVGVDSLNNIYVACNGTHYGGTDLRKFDSAGNLVWKQFGLEFVNCGDFDPGSDTIYTTKERFTMNYANTAPGSEWSYTAFTGNPFKAGDVRNISGGGICGVQVRRLTTGNNVFMYSSGQGQAPPVVMYRFNNQGQSFQGTTATPFGRIYPGGSPTGYGFKLWIDTNADGQEVAGECTQVNNPLAGLWSYDVDSGGDIWMNQGGGFSLSNPLPGIGRLPCTGTQTIGTSPNTAVIPQYNPAGAQFFLCPAPIFALQSLKYDKAHDVMYCLGQKTDKTWVLARYDNWLSCPTPDDHPARYVIPLPDNATDVTMLAQPGTPDIFKGYMGMAFAGDKIFIADLWSPVRVYDANLGNPVITLVPGPEVSGSDGWEDMVMGLNATKRSNGEYLIQEANTGGGAYSLLYRWTPTTDTTVPGVPMNLTATPQGRSIALAWTGPLGLSTSYNIYRGTSSGSLTLYQSNVNTCAYVDANVTLGTTYYYTVAAVSTMGTGAQSNQASAAPLSTQVEFVKYDTTTKGTWYTGSMPTPTSYAYGSEGYCIPGIPSDFVSLPSAYVASLAHTNAGVFAQNSPDDPPHVMADSQTDSRWLRKTSGSDRTTSYYAVYGSTAPTSSQWHDITFKTPDLDSGKWHQVSIYLMDWPGQPRDIKVEVLDLATGTVLDIRQPMNYSQGKWVVWNVRGNVRVRLTNSSGSWPVLCGIFFDPVQPSAPTLGWWKLDEVNPATIAGDSSGAGNNCNKIGGTWTAGAHPGFNGCLTYGGTSGTSQLSMGGFNSTSSTKLTYATWFKTATSGVILGMWNAGPTAFAPVLYVGTDNKLHGAFYTGVIQNMKSAGSVNDNTWHHVALTCDGELQTLYLDGELVGALSAPTSHLSYAWYFFVGGQGYVTGWPNTTGSQSYFNGQVDDIRLYNRVLSNSEIWKLFNP